MALQIPGCLGRYDFDQVIRFANKRFVEGWDTITLLEQARSQQEREEIILISLLDVEDNQLKGLQLACPHARHCGVRNCRQRLKQMFREHFQSAAPAPGKSSHDAAPPGSV